MTADFPLVRLRNAWRSTHPWIFQKLVEKPAQKPRPGTIVDIVGPDGEWIGRGFYNGHSRIALRILETDRDVPVDAGWFARKIAAAVSLRRDVLRLAVVRGAGERDLAIAEAIGVGGTGLDQRQSLHRLAGRTRRPGRAPRGARARGLERP